MTTLETALARRVAVPRSLRIPGVVPVAAFAVGAITWPVATLSPALLRENWQVGLHMAAAGHLAAGRDIVFTYGPLGFLGFPLLVTSATAIASFVFAGAMHLAIVATVLRAARRRLPLAGALVVAGVAGTVPLPVADALVVVVLGASVAVLADDDERGGPFVVVLGGAIAAFELLIKLNDGVVCLAIAALAAWRLRPRRLRSEALLAASFCFFLAVFWRAAGSPVGELPGWLRLGAHLLVSYAQGMRLDGDPGTLRSGVALLGAFVLLALVAARGVGRARGLALTAALAVFGLAFFKEGFVRADDAHTSVFFAALAVAPLVLAPRAAAFLLGAFALRQAGYEHELDAGLLALVAIWMLGRQLVPARPAVAAAATAAAAVALVLAVPATELPALHVGDTAHEIATLASGTRRAQEIDAAKASVRVQKRLPADVLAALRGHTVDVEPYGATIAWAYGLTWRPEPLLESYAAYDPALDRFAANVLADRGAERILLLDRTAIDGRQPLWEAPALVLTELCDYRRVAAARGYSVLARDPGGCSTPTALGTARVDGGWVDVPRAHQGELVYAELHLHTGLAAAVRSLVLRPPAVRITTAPGAATAPIVPATAADPLVMGAATSFAHIAVRRFRVAGATGRVTFFAVTARH